MGKAWEASSAPRLFFSETRFRHGRRGFRGRWTIRPKSIESRTFRREGGSSNADGRSTCRIREARPRRRLVGKTKREVVKPRTSQVGAEGRFTGEFGIEDEAVGVGGVAIESIGDLAAREGLFEADGGPIGGQGGFEQEGIGGGVEVESGEVEERFDQHRVQAPNAAAGSRRERQAVGSASGKAHAQAERAEAAENGIEHGRGAVPMPRVAGFATEFEQVTDHPQGCQA